MKKYRTLLIIVGAFVVGFATAWLISHTPDTLSKQVRQGDGKYTNPLLECEVAQNSINAEKVNFGLSLKDFVSEIEQNPAIHEIAVYFRDLNNGPTFGIKQEDPFIPASLLKVPIMMAYYKNADTNPQVLNTMLTVSESEVAQAGMQQIPPERSLVEGASYSVGSLIEQMITYSDNVATILLFKNLPLENQIHLYELLGVDTSVITNPAASLSVKQYAAFFRILFNASFLSQGRSEQALELLTRSAFKNGLRAGVPEEIEIAHKFGERKIAGSGKQQVHDCGIVYYPNHPYLLCIMTRGDAIPTLEKAIADISAFAYEKIDRQYR